MGERLERLTVSVSQAAELLGIAKNSAYAACARGDIPSLKIGKRIVISRVAIDRLLAAGTNQGQKGKA